jgi:hypothetical protein
MQVPKWSGGIVLAVCVVLVVAFLYKEGATVSKKTISATPTTSNSSSLEASPIPAVTIATTSTKVSSSTAAIPAKAKIITSAAPVTVPAVSSATQQAQALSSAGSQLLKSVVNIVCLSGDPSIPSISGSGVMIDSRGIILTAAHVAQLFLLQDYLGQDKVTCIIRTGSPARRAYYAEPIYVSQSWLKNNPTTLIEKNPKGTGENDVALLAITSTATSTPLPSSFAATPLATRDPIVGERLAIGSYGAQYLDSADLNTSLYPILTFGGVEGRYTYGTNTVDVMTVNGGGASQEGSSGGGLVTSDDQLIGTITTSSVSGDFSSRLLNAVTTGHLRRSFSADMGENLDSILANESLASLVNDFKSQSSILGARLSSTITANK